MSLLLEQIHEELRELALKGDESGFNQLLRIAGDIVYDVGEDPWIYQIPWLIEPTDFPNIPSGWVRINWPSEYFDQRVLNEYGERVNQFAIGPFPAQTLHCLCNTSSKRMLGYNLVWRSDWKLPHTYSRLVWDFLQGFKRSSP